MTDNDIIDRTLIAHYTLLPCPFCGSKNVSVYGTYSAYGICLDCESATGLHRGQQAAAEAWNKRAKITIEQEEKTIV